jgi:hypothetical protein
MTTRQLANAANASARPSTAGGTKPLEVGWNEWAQDADGDDRESRA